jgi:hypothetical protein
LSRALDSTSAAGAAIKAGTAVRRATAESFMLKSYCCQVVTGIKWVACVEAAFGRSDNVMILDCCELLSENDVAEKAREDPSFISRRAPLSTH